MEDGVPPSLSTCPFALVSVLTLPGFDEGQRFLARLVSNEVLDQIAHRVRTGGTGALREYLLSLSGECDRNQAGATAVPARMPSTAPTVLAGPSQPPRPAPAATPDLRISTAPPSSVALSQVTRVEQLNNRSSFLPMVSSSTHGGSVSATTSSYELLDAREYDEIDNESFDSWSMAHTQDGVDSALGESHLNNNALLQQHSYLANPGGAIETLPGSRISPTPYQSNPYLTATARMPHRGSLRPSNTYRRGSGRYSHQGAERPFSDIAQTRRASEQGPMMTSAFPPLTPVIMPTNPVHSFNQAQPFNFPLPNGYAAMQTWESEPDMAPSHGPQSLSRVQQRGGSGQARLFSGALANQHGTMGAERHQVAVVDNPAFAEIQDPENPEYFRY
jgi:hypothetical protein